MTEHFRQQDSYDKVRAFLPKEPTHPISIEDKAYYCQAIRTHLKTANACIIAHYYVDNEIQALAEATGGIVADSLEMARFGANHSATTLIVCGVRFMGETAKMLSPEKTVLMPTLKAECSLDLCCEQVQFKAFCDKHPEREIVVYANTSAKIKAMADWVVTSSIAVDVVKSLHQQGKKLIWAPDRYLGGYITDKTGADMLIWPGACIVHEEFKANALKQLMEVHPEAAVLVHPESPREVVNLATVVGSTSQLLKASQSLPHQRFIVATDKGIFYKMQQHSPEKSFIAAPTGGVGATCRSCAHCPWMGMNNLALLHKVLVHKHNEIKVDAAISERALVPLARMLNFKQQAYCS